MKVQQFIKKLNNTELGKTGIHEYYVLVPQNVNLSEMFDAPNTNPNFYDRRSKQILDNIRFTSDRETRIVGLGTYYRENHVCAGDEILFERVDDQNGTQFNIDLNSFTDLILFQKMSKGFEVLNLDRLLPKLINNECLISTIIHGITGNLEIKFIGRFKKREDSPILTNFYDLFANGINIKNHYGHNELIELKFSENNSYLNQISTWQKYEFNWTE